MIKTKTSVSGLSRAFIRKEYKLKWKLFANKGDLSYKSFGKKHYYDRDLWRDPSLPDTINIIPADYSTTKRVGDELYDKAMVKLYFIDGGTTEKFFDTDEDAERYYNDICQKFGLKEI